MTEHQPFLKAIADQPHDLQLRLVYADWLEEQGDPQADYIRTQIEIHQGDDYPAKDCNGWDGEFPSPAVDRYGQVTTISPCQCAWHRSRRHCQALLKEHALVWMERLFGPIHEVQFPHDTAAAVRVWPLEECTDWLTFTFRQGFPERLQSDWQNWSTLHRELRTACPIQKVALTGRLPEIEYANRQPYGDHSTVRFPGMDWRLWRHPPGRHYREVLLDLLQAYWPGLEFDWVDALIRRAPIFPISEPVNIAIQTYQGMQDRIIQSLGIPAELAGGPSNFASSRANEEQFRSSRDDPPPE